MIARAESGQARDDLKEFDASGIARDIYELYEPLAEEHGLTMALKADAPAILRGNRELVSQALANLVENAIKYAGPRERQVPADAPAEAPVAPAIAIEAGLSGETVLLGVADHGPGIPEADRGRVVDRFVRLEASRTLPGSGLGLSLASAVATLHGGELRLADNNPGLRAVLALPVRGPELNVHESSRGGERGQ